jgi:Uncharacterized conserved protein
MARYRERSLPAGRGPRAQLTCLLGPLLVLGCGSDRATPDAGQDVPDANTLESEGSIGIAPNLDARIGLAGGSVCDVSAQCLSGACTLGICSDWAHAILIGIDTTAAGADVSEAVMEFPLLVRLDAMNFAFGEARRDGADIRFLDASGNNLGYEIERWDAEKAVAELWVLVPRITGDSRNNFVSMYWGNPLSATTSFGPSVFGGSSCVFHMGEDTNISATQIEDDSGQDNTGLVLGTPGTDPRGDGIIGSGLALDGKSTYLATLLQQAPPQRVTISLWLKTTSTTGGGIAGFASKPSGNDVLFDRSIAMDSSGRLSFAVLHGSAPATVTSLASYDDGQWHFIVARFSSSGQYLFVDGDSVADDPTMTGADSYEGYWRFGEEPTTAPSAVAPDAAVSTGDFISGSIDETRVTTDETSDAWIKLSYATQRPGAAAVVYPAR